MLLKLKLWYYYCLFLNYLNLVFRTFKSGVNNFVIHESYSCKEVMNYILSVYLSTWLFLGMTSEGIYRVSGFADDIELLKNLYDKG